MNLRVKKTGWTTLAALAVMALSMNAFANDQLAKDMDAMASNYKTIKTQISNASQNASSIQAIDNMGTAINDALTQTPDSVASMPADQQAQALAQFQALLNQVKDDLAQLRGDLTQNDNTDAATVLTAIDAIKSQGHSIFDPN
jgi:acyl-CoA reductase-like NAD-dependent aldehyde dehydrogenase